MKKPFLIAAGLFLSFFVILGVMAVFKAPESVAFIRARPSDELPLHVHSAANGWRQLLKPTNTLVPLVAPKAIAQHQAENNPKLPRSICGQQIAGTIPD